MKFKHILLATAALFAIAACTTTQNTPPAKASSGTAPVVSAPASPATATAVAPSLFAKLKAWWSSDSAAVAALKAETSSLLKSAVFAAGKDKLAGANWADSAAAGIYAARDLIAKDPTQLNKLLGTALPVNQTWTTVIDGLVSKLLTGQLATASQRSAALDGIAQTLNASAASARTGQ